MSCSRSVARIASHSIMSSTVCFIVFFIMTCPPPTSTLFPYTTLFRSLLEPTHVDLVDGSPEDQIPHGRHTHQHRARLVRRERHHGIADLDRVLEDVAVDGSADHRLHLLAAGQHLATLL